jgi:hypothetical protein
LKCFGVYFRPKLRWKTKKTKANVPKCASRTVDVHLENFRPKLKKKNLKNELQTIIKHNKLQKYTCLVCFLSFADLQDGFLRHEEIKTRSKRPSYFPTTGHSQNAPRRRKINIQAFALALWLVEIRSRSQIRPIIAQFEHLEFFWEKNSTLLYYRHDQMRKSPYLKSKSLILSWTISRFTLFLVFVIC